MDADVYAPSAGGGYASVYAAGVDGKSFAVVADYDGKSDGSGMVAADEGAECGVDGVVCAEDAADEDDAVVANGEWDAGFA